MKKILLFCFTIYVWAYTCFSFFAHYLLFSCTRFFVKDKRSWSFFLTKLFVVPAFKVLAFPLHVHGLENVYTEKNFIVASNHQSLLDIIVFMATLRRPFSFFAKEELLKVPVLGSDIRNQGHFVVDRKNPRRAVKQMMDARKKMEGGYSLLIFPEGTRSIDDTIAPFKRGAFLLASQTGTPIIPTYLTGTGRAMNKKRFLASPSRIDLYFGDPIAVQKSESKADQKKTAEITLERVRASMLKLKALHEKANLS